MSARKVRRMAAGVLVAGVVSFAGVSDATAQVAPTVVVCDNGAVTGSADMPAWWVAEHCVDTGVANGFNVNFEEEDAAPYLADLGVGVAPELIQEDDPRWDCETMGNRICGGSDATAPVAHADPSSSFDLPPAVQAFDSGTVWVLVLAGVTV